MSTSTTSTSTSTTTISTTTTTISTTTISTTSTSTTSTTSTSTTITTTTTSTTSTTTTLAHEILTLTPEFGMQEKIRFKTLQTPFESGRQRRSAFWDKGLREFRLTTKFLTPSQMNTIWDFYISHKGKYQSFLVKITHEYEITGESLGAGDSAEDTFTLDEFPVDTSGNFTLYDAGSEVSGSLTNDFTNEISKAVYDSAPAGALTIDYEFYFLVHFSEDELSREMVAYQLLHTSMILEEIKWTSYKPRAGNA